MRFSPAYYRIIPAVISLLLFSIAIAESEFPFQGIVKEGGINIRSDSTVNSGIIATVGKGRELTVVGESYGWYKVRLPIDTPSYISRGLAVCLDEPCQDAKVVKNKSRVRLKPSKDSLVLGVAQKDETVHVLGKDESWYKIQPVENSFGWIHKKFIEKKPEITANPVAVEIPLTTTSAVKQEQAQPQAKKDGEITLTGIVTPYGKVFGRKATHKLLTQDKEVFLLKGDKKELNGFNYRRAKVKGVKITAQENKKFTTIEVNSIEELK